MEAKSLEAILADDVEAFTESGMAQQASWSDMVELASSVQSVRVLEHLVTQEKFAREPLPHDVLHNATSEGYADVVRALLKHPMADVNGMDENEYAPIHAAAVMGRVEALDALASTGELNLDHAGQDGVTALHMAVERNEVATVTRLLELGANPNLRNCVGLTPLHLAALSEDGSALIKALLEHPLTDKEAEHDGGNALWLAARRSRARNAQALLAAGVSHTHAYKSYREFIQNAMDVQYANEHSLMFSLLLVLLLILVFAGGLWVRREWM